MNWYKISQTKNYSTWLSDQIQKYTDNYTKPLPPLSLSKTQEEYLQMILDWAEETHPDLKNIGLYDAGKMAEQHSRDKKYLSQEKQDKFKLNKWWANTQNIDPKSPNFAIDIRTKHKPIPPNIKKKINNEIHDLGNYHQSIPLDTIFNICEKHGVVVLQEDGTKWSGLLMGGAECGSDEARNQVALFTLALKNEVSEYIPSSSGLSLNWCVMPSGKYEIVCYVS